MKKRSMTALVAVPLLLTVLFVLPKICTAVLLSLICGIAALELLHNTKYIEHKRLQVYSVIYAMAIPFWCYFGMDHAWTVGGVLVYFVLLFLEVMESRMQLRFEKIAMCAVSALLIPYMLCSIVRILLLDIGRYIVLIPFAVGFLSDTGAYFIGCRFGKHKLAPSISPNKTVEGVIGGIAFALIGMVIYAFILQLLQLQVNYLAAIVYALVGSVFGMFGDLCLSTIKRQAGIKDFGYVFPGHGGVLDRFDSVLLVAPLMELLLIIFPMVVME